MSNVHLHCLIIFLYMSLINRSRHSGVLRKLSQQKPGVLNCIAKFFASFNTSVRSISRRQPAYWVRISFSDRSSGINYEAVGLRPWVIDESGVAPSPRAPKGKKYQNVFVFLFLWRGGAAAGQSVIK